MAVAWASERVLSAGSNTRDRAPIVCYTGWMMIQATIPTRYRITSAVQLGLALTTVTGCVAERDVTAGTAPAQVQAPVVYGDDDRQDYFEASDPVFAELLRSATVAFVDPAYIDVSDPDDVVPSTVTLGEYEDLCPSERFVDQWAMASCSGTLIDDDLVLTAAHCVDATVCSDWYLVFGFYMTAAGELNRMTAADVYTCAEIVLAEYTTDESDETWHDYAIIRLDRSVDAGRAPAPVARDASTVEVGDGLTVLGFGSGIPGKVHGGASVRRAVESWGYFRGSTDTFAGNSGSGTYNDDHELIGVFTRGGDRDYVKRGGDCAVVNTLRESEATQEYDYAAKAVADLCARHYPSERLCGGDEPTPEATPETAPEASPEVTPEAGPEATPEPAAESTSEATAEASPDASEPTSPEGSDGCGVTSGPASTLLLVFAAYVRRRRYSTACLSC